MRLGLVGVRALVVAASSGLGHACARSLATEGAKVAISARDSARLVSAVHQTGAIGSIACDLTSAAEIRRLIDQAAAQLGGIDALIVNSGPPPVARFEDASDSDWQSSHVMVVMSAVRLMRAALPYLQRSGRGRIVTITGYGMREPQSNLVVSEATRASVALTAKVIANDYAVDGITVNNIAPGPILTDRLRELQSKEAADAGISLNDQLARYAQKVPARRVGTPSEIGDLCAYLCSEQAGFITGQTIVVDGGINRAV